ncbi:MarR family winged helix-turn-helix transcriptional regulator [Luteipulveratus halotolerans]|uniref:MarR family transcriptional regulator n=1 Tax=Luteipulveratus halotolerans TaxID=1631356 RepID=A0A0L6CK77_9MICO|nr:MarR family transcriptional regulator [Luteipulveratus halotolerans]KNX38139.1 MarR family transcriptional regulator [Luteipulveratus halotolerans]
MSTAARRRLAGELRSVCMRISRRSRFENTETIAPHQFSVLARLEKSDATARELAEHERVSAPSMSRTIKCLVDEGYIARTDDPHDGRQTILSLTPEGRTALKQTRRSRDEWMLTRLGDLTDEECAVLEQARDILGRVAAR